jgi:carboxyl-terminal processing protease
MYNDMIPVNERDAINAKIQEIDAFINNNYLFYTEIDKEKVEYGIFSGYISGIGDKNTVYMTPQEFANRDNLEKGQLITCGINAENEGSDYIKVVEVYPGSDAESSGVLKDDIITYIDGRDVLEMGQASAIKFLEGEENTRVDITVQRDGAEINHSLVRKATDIISVEYCTLNNVGFVRIAAFSALTPAQFDEALNSFARADEDEKIRALIIDVRNNSSDVFISDTTIGKMTNRLVVSSAANTAAFSEHRGGIRKDYIVTDNTKIFEDKIPVVVLVDSGTSGAGELLAAILKEFADAQTVGVNTAGNPFIQQTQVLKDSSAIRVTVAKIILNADWDYENIGIIPDFPVELSGEILENMSIFAQSQTGQAIDISEIYDEQIRKAFDIIDTMNS